MTELDPEAILRANVKATLARLAEAQRIIARDGIELKWGRGTRPNPFLRYELEQRVLLIRLLRALPLAPTSESFEEAIERLMSEGS